MSITARGILEMIVLVSYFLSLSGHLLCRRELVASLWTRFLNNSGEILTNGEVMGRQPLHQPPQRCTQEIPNPGRVRDIKKPFYFTLP